MLPVICNAQTIDWRDFPTRNDWSGLDLSGQDMSGQRRFESDKFIGTNLSNANLSETTLHDADMTGANLAGANLSGAGLRGTKLVQADLTRANLTGTNLSNAQLGDANFADARIESAWLPNITPEQLHASADYQDRDLSGLTLGQLNSTIAGFFNFAEQDLTSSILWSWLEDADFTAANLTDARVHVRNGNFSNATLRRANVAGDKSNFSNADLTDASFNASGGILTGSSIAGARITNISDEQLYSTRSYHNRSLEGIHFRGDANRGLDMTGFDLVGQNLAGAHFLQTQLTNADFQNASLDGAHFFKVTDLESIRSSRSWKTGDLAEMSFDNVDLSGWDFSGANLDGAVFHAVRFEETQFSGASLAATTFQNVEHLASIQDSASWRSGHLGSLVFRDVDLSHWDIRNKNLEHATFYSTNLQNADFSNSQLRGAMFLGLYSGGVNGADFSDTNLSATKWIGELQDADFSRANLAEANLQGTKLAGADFSHAILSNANFYAARDAVIPPTAETRNTVMPDGRIHGVDLRDGETLLVPMSTVWIHRRFTEYANDPSLPDVVFRDPKIEVTEDFVMHAAANLVLELGAAGVVDFGLQTDAEYASAMLFADDTNVQLNGSLVLRYAEFPRPLQQSPLQLFYWPHEIDTSNRFESVDLPYGHWDTSELYSEGRISFISTEAIVGDLNHDGQLTAYDVDKLSEKIRTGGTLRCSSPDQPFWEIDTECGYDLNSDGILDLRDHAVWVEDAMGTLPGDADLNGFVAFNDFVALAASFNRESGWANGDFDGSGVTDFKDFSILSRNFGLAATSISVPEPSKYVLTVFYVLPFTLRRRR